MSDDILDHFQAQESGIDIVIQIIAPVFGLILLGYLAGRLKWISDAGIDGLAEFAFNFAIPVMLFTRISSVALPETVPWEFLAVFYGITLTLFAAALLFGRKMVGGSSSAAIFSMAGTYSNVILIGIPLVLAALPDAAIVPLFIIVSTHAALLFFVTTLFAERSSGSVSDLQLKTLTVLFKNPIFSAVVMGVLANLAGLSLPNLVEAPIRTMVDYLSAAALPCAVFSMGASISRYRIEGSLAVISAVLIIKNLVHPMIVLMVALTLGWDEDNRTWLQVALLLSACPTGINVYLFAQRYNALEPTIATAVVLSTALSVLTLSAVLWWIHA
ncbi:MAG: hypothetical protein CMQ05_00795 [Gammaproteobacteria bacterium]|uniref:Transporter n=1 Tax=OM182 bacterium MED-G24 TaxID=1986255 RepID=A0A2A5WJ53_9GAMM|nr:hypothetical protein [Gammaproteobacteria bacterium]PDH36323.1 MAG: hypothetical protein CNE99_09840 [OM182 bacterium MED-G24]RPG25626.1 MAG: AEC family transporter [Gammaproteobacteria bacterium TMED50]